MDSSQTLHDFVLNLISNPQALTAFQLDPEGMLQDAGLSDITALDVQDVVPLVIDFAPVQGLAGLDTDQLGLGSLDLSAGTAIEQLQMVTQQVSSLSLPTGDGNVAVAGTLAGVGELSGWGGLTQAENGLTLNTGGGGDLLGLGGNYGDVSATLDSAALTGAVDNVTAVTGNADALVGTVEGTAGPLLDTLDVSTLTGTVSGVTGTLTGLTGVAGGLPAVGDVTGTLTGVAGGVPVVGDVTGTVTGVTGGLTDTLGVHLGGMHTMPGVDGSSATVEGSATVSGSGVESSGLTSNLLGGDSLIPDASDLPVAGDVLGGSTGLLGL